MSRPHLNRRQLLGGAAALGLVDALRGGTLAQWMSSDAHAQTTPRAPAPTRRWQNWSGLQQATPATWAAPAHEAELQQLLRRTRGEVRAVGDKKGLTRYGHAYVPLDEALSRVVVDFSGRPGLAMDVKFTAGMIGALDTQLVFEFFQGFVNHALVSLHVDNLKGHNAHHQCETIFKAFGRAIRMAITPDPRSAGVIPSTKGCL